MSTAPVADLLATIVAATRRGVAFRENERPLAQLDRDTSRTPEGGRFLDGLRAAEAPRVIAECKRRSPSRGILRAAYDPALHARQYAEAGAVAISVLTEPTFFDGQLEHLRAVRAAVSIPVLRKDFIVSEYQIAEAAWLGADAILLIVGALDDRTLAGLLEASRQRGLAALVEVHDSRELAPALDAGAEIIGVNSRNLRTLSVDPHILEQLVDDVPSHVVRVAESGITGPEDIARLSRAGYDAFLVGERLIARPDPGAALRELRGR